MSDQEVTLTIDFTGTFQKEEIRQWTDKETQEYYPPHILEGLNSNLLIFQAMMQYDLQSGAVTIDELLHEFMPKVKSVSIKDVT